MTSIYFADCPDAYSILCIDVHGRIVDSALAETHGLARDGEKKQSSLHFSKIRVWVCAGVCTLYKGEES